MLADAAAEPLNWLTAIGWLGGIVFVLRLWLNGTLVRRKDVDTGAAEMRAAFDVRYSALADRCESLRADRDAWRDAHGTAIEALRALELSKEREHSLGELAVGLLRAVQTQAER